MHKNTFLKRSGTILGSLMYLGCSYGLSHCYGQLCTQECIDVQHTSDVKYVWKSLWYGQLSPGPMFGSILYLNLSPLSLSLSLSLSLFLSLSLPLSLCFSLSLYLSLSLCWCQLSDSWKLLCSGGIMNHWWLLIFNTRVTFSLPYQCLFVLSFSFLNIC